MTKTEQIIALQAEFGKMSGMDIDGPVYAKLCKILDKADKRALQDVVAANIKFVSTLARNRLIMGQAQ